MAPQGGETLITDSSGYGVAKASVPTTTFNLGNFHVGDVASAQRANGVRANAPSVVVAVAEQHYRADG